MSFQLAKALRLEGKGSGNSRGKLGSEDRASMVIRQN